MKQYIYAVSVHTRKGELKPGLSFYDLSKQLASQLPECFGFLFRDSVILVFSRDEEIPGESFFEPLLAMMKKYDMAAGISNAFSSLKSLRQYGFQTRKALQFGMVLHKDESFYFYKDYAVYHMIEL